MDTITPPKFLGEIMSNLDQKPKLVSLPITDSSKECLDALEEAKKHDFDEVIVLGFNKEGDFVRYTNSMSLRDKLYLLEVAKELYMQDIYYEDE